MKKFFCSATLLLLFTLAYAQSPSKVPSQAAFVELGGAGLVYSFNYDFRFDAEDMNSWGMRVGAGGYSIEGTSLLTAPVQVNKLFGKSRHFFEIGGGATFVFYRNKMKTYQYHYDDQTNESYYLTEEYTDKNFYWIFDTGKTPSLMGTLNFGYRKVPEDGGFLFSANLIPAFNHEGFWPLWFGLGFGYAF